MGFKMSYNLRFCAGLLLFHAGVLSAQLAPFEKIAVGAIFDQNTEEIQNVFKYAMMIHKQNISSRRLELQAYVDVINTADAFKLSRLIAGDFDGAIFRWNNSLICNENAGTYRKVWMPIVSGSVAKSLRVVVHDNEHHIFYITKSIDLHNLCLEEVDKAVSRARGPPPSSPRVCNQFARGVFAMLGAVTPESFDTLHSYTNTFQMPFVTPWFPEKVIPPSSGLIDHAVSMRPDYHRAIVDTIVHYGWKEIIYVYDSHDVNMTFDVITSYKSMEKLDYRTAFTNNHDAIPLLTLPGLLRLQQLYQSMQPGRTAFRISLVKRINNATEAMEFLLALEQTDRWGNKCIVLDCNAKNAKSILVEHVRKVELGRRTYHYMLSGLVMDDHWENEVTEYGAVNITGFRLVDHSRRVVRDFMDDLRRKDARFKGSISAETALMYDGVQVLMDALSRLWRKKPDAFRTALRRAAGQANSTKVIDCNPGKSWVVPFEHGDKISRLIKKTDIEGLTGNISFNEEGHRHNFSVQVVEMTVQSAMIQVATWSDTHGLKLLPSKQVQLHSPSSYNMSKTYIVTTIFQEPYMMLKTEFSQKEEQYHGFCKDLTDLVMKHLGVKYVIRPVKDGLFGHEGPEGWSGLVGEIVRKEADIAIAPLAVTPEREQVIDFSEPFLSVGNPIVHSKIPKQLSDTFSFLRPLSKEIWLCVLFSFFAVSIVLFLVSRFSPYEWRSVTISDTHLDHPVTSTNEIILHNEFSIWNSFWFSLGSFMQQGSDIVPKSLSGRIVGTVWWFFALILVCSYTANLAAYLIVERISEPARYIHYSPGEPHSEGADFVPWNTLMKNQELMRDEETFMQIVEKGWDIACDSMSRICRYRHVNFAIGLQKGSPLREDINLALVKLKKDGVVTKLWRKWLLTKKSNCDYVKDEEMTITEMSLSQVAGIFYVLVCGLGVALCVALVEFCQHGRAEAARANVPLRAALSAKARLASAQRARDTKPPPRRATHHATPDRDRLPWNGGGFAGYFTAGTQISQEDAVTGGFTHV